MKKIVALLLTAALLLGCTAALAADYTVEEKFYRQMLQNGTKASVTFAAEGDSASLLPDWLWQLLRAMAPAVQMDMRHCITRGNGQADAALLISGEEKMRIEALYDADTVALRWPVLTEKWLAAPTGWDWSRLAAPLMNDNGNAVPPLRHLITEALLANEDWKAMAAPKMEAYQTKLGLWINSYAASTTGTDENGVVYSELNCSVPAAALKEELKQLLREVYADEALLVLLRQIALPEEAAAYLTPAALPYFTAWVDAMQLDDTVEVVRRYDGMAQPLLDKMKLPFAQGQEIACLTVEVASAPEGQRTRLLMQGWDDTGIELTYTEQAPLCFRGEVKVTQPEGAAQGFRYDCVWTQGEETYSLSTDLCEKKMGGTLNLIPLEGTPLPAQTVTLEVLFSTRSEKRSPSTLTATVKWQDATTGAALTAQMQARTTAAWAFDPVSTLTDVRRLDQMDAAEVGELLASVREKVIGIVKEKLAGILAVETVPEE